MKLRDIMNPTNVRDFIEGNYMMWKDQLRNSGIAKHYKEQAIYRALLCRPCLVNGRCVECGCKTPNMFFSINKEDSQKKWGKMLEAEEWEAFKKDNDIDELPDSFDLIKDIENGKHTGQVRGGQELLGDEPSISNNQ
jgi:hypothetical protein